MSYSYHVTDRFGDTVATVSSVVKAIAAAEGHMQCGVNESIAQVREALRLIGTTRVTCRVDNGVYYWIDRRP